MSEVNYVVWKLTDATAEFASDKSGVNYPIGNQNSALAEAKCAASSGTSTSAESTSDMSGLNRSIGNQISSTLGAVYAAAGPTSAMLGAYHLAEH